MLFRMFNPNTAVGTSLSLTLGILNQVLAQPDFAPPDSGDQSHNPGGIAAGVLLVTMGLGVIALAVGCKCYYDKQPENQQGSQQPLLNRSRV